MTFSYCANINSIEVGKKIFFGDIVPLGYKIDDETSESLESRLKKTLLRYIGFAALVIIFLIILLIVIK